MTDAVPESTAAAPDDRVKVIMRSTSIADDGTPVIFEATDWVAPDHLDAYTTDAQTRWQYVTTDTEAVMPPDVANGDYNPPVVISDLDSTIPTGGN